MNNEKFILVTETVSLHKHLIPVSKILEIEECEDWCFITMFVYKNVPYGMRVVDTMGDIIAQLELR